MSEEGCHFQQPQIGLKPPVSQSIRNSPRSSRVSQIAPWMRYHEYRHVHLPIGSGVTEAGCKTVFTQRAKLSGMRWKKDGLQVILTFRMLIVSDVWESTFAASLTSSSPLRITPLTAA